MSSSGEYLRRISAAQEAMAARGVDALVLSIGRDLPYLTGYEAMPTERPTLGVVRASGSPAIVVPNLEAARIDAAPAGVAVHAWSETDDPFAVATDLLDGAATVAVGAEMWSAFLLRLQQPLGTTSFVEAGPLMAGLRVHKSEAEISNLRNAGAAADRVAARLASTKFSGRTERSLARDIGEMLIEEGHATAAFTMVGSGPNGASPHHSPGDREISPGEAVVVDFGGIWDGYYSDTTRTFHVGEPSDEVRTVHATVAEAQQAAFESVAPGVAASEVDAVARGIIESAGFGEYFIHRTGHGIGLDVHEDPYLVAGNDAALEPGMAFSIEPGIYLPGRFGVRIEDIVVLTPDGPERLNESPRDLLVVA